MISKSPKKHQEEAYQFWVRNNGRGLNADDPGLGKTLSSILYLDRENMWPALVVGPASTKGVWANELKEWAGKDSTIVGGRKCYTEPVATPATIINYDILADQLPWLAEQDYKVIIFDEAHSLQSMDTRWTKAAIALAKRCARVQGLTGTPIANHTRTLFPILHIIRPDLFPSFHRFAWSYCDPKFLETQGRWDYNGSSNPDLLHKAIQPFTIRRKKEILNLPKQSIRMETVEMDNRESYDALHKQYQSMHYGFGNPSGTDKLTMITKLLMATARGKARAVVKWLQDSIAANPGEKLIVFCTHTGMLDVIYRRVSPGRALMINGSVSSKKRTKFVEQFQTDPQIDLIVCNIKSGGAGITLTAATKTVFVELPWVPKDINQAKDRNFRIGQTEETEVIYLVAADTIEGKLCRALQTKSQSSDEVIEGSRTNSLNLFDMLKETV